MWGGGLDEVQATLVQVSLGMVFHPLLTKEQMLRILCIHTL